MFSTNDCVPAGTFVQVMAGDVPSPGAAPGAAWLNFTGISPPSGKPCTVRTMAGAGGAAPAAGAAPGCCAAAGSAATNPLTTIIAIVLMLKPFVVVGSSANVSRFARRHYFFTLRLITRAVTNASADAAITANLAAASSVGSGNASVAMKIDIVKPMPPMQPITATSLQLTSGGNLHQPSLTPSAVAPTMPTGFPTSSASTMPATSDADSSS